MYRESNNRLKGLIAIILVLIAIASAATCCTFREIKKENALRLQAAEQCYRSLVVEGGYTYFPADEILPYGKMVDDILYLSYSRDGETERIGEVYYNGQEFFIDGESVGINFELSRGPYTVSLRSCEGAYIGIFRQPDKEENPVQCMHSDGDELMENLIPGINVTPFEQPGDYIGFSGGEGIYCLSKKELSHEINDSKIKSGLTYEAGRYFGYWYEIPNQVIQREGILYWSPDKGYVFEIPLEEGTNDHLVDQAWETWAAQMYELNGTRYYPEEEGFYPLQKCVIMAANAYLIPVPKEVRSLCNIENIEALKLK